MLHVFVACLCRMSNLRNDNVAYISVPCRMSLGLMSHVDFKKELCRHVKFRGRGPLYIANTSYKVTNSRHLSARALLMIT